MGLLLRLWRGECGLGRTYWAFGWCVGLAYVVVEALVESAPPVLLSTSAGLPGLVVGLAHLGYHAFWTVGVCRAARKYDGRRVWVILAAAMAVLSWAAVAWSLVSGAPGPWVLPVPYFHLVLP